MKNSSKIWPWIRRISQIVFFGCFLYIIWTTRYPLQVFINPSLFFQLDPLAMFLTALAERVWLPGLGFTLATIAVTLIFGRVFCGWFCPLGATLDFLSWINPLGRKRPGRGREADPSRWLLLKYGLLAVLAALALAGVQAIWFFDPLAIFVRTFSFNFNPWLNAGVDRLFAWLLPAADFPGWMDTTYNWLKEMVLDVRSQVFPHAGLVFWVFAAIAAAVLIRRRFWCRTLCPLGALLGLVSRWAWLRRDTGGCNLACGACRDICRTNAIRSDNRYHPQECVMCMDCAVAGKAGCPTGKTTFRFRRPGKPEAKQSPEAGPLTRAQFLGLLASGLVASQGCRKNAPASPAPAPAVLRPPASLPEGEFVQRCVRCGNCMKVCLTNVLQPSLWETGAAGIWTPRLEPSIAYCEYSCTLCGQVCPTSAIREITEEEKLRTRIGLAVVDRNRCLPWAEGTECLVCEEHCPIPEKAIKREFFVNAHGQKVGRPVVDPKLCVGCAICENKCPVRPLRAIRVRPL